MNKMFLFLLVVIFTLSNNLLLSSDYKFPYNIQTPVNTHILPDILHEISGITLINNTELACVQDEKGIIFIYSIDKKKIVRQHEFYGDGDYEGIAIIDKVLYILKSDGFIYEFSGYDSKKPKTKKYHIKLPALNNEGLCYDKENNRLLIAGKSKFKNKSEADRIRAIHAFDLKTGKLHSRPVFEILLNDIQKFMNNKKIYIPKKNKKANKFTQKKLKFTPSAIAIHPLTKELYMLSATEHLLYVFSLTGEILHVETLNPSVFLKAEGITFDDRGNLYIANEGKNLKPTLLIFKPKE